MQYFDLNIEQVLEHWTVAHAVRELLANALDEHLLGHSDAPEVWKDDRTGAWHVRDTGRGLRAEHFTQNENPEKLLSDAVIGRFGVGLKDALAVLDRHHIGVVIETPTATITTVRRPKADFGETVTLHAAFGDPPSGAPIDRRGTHILLSGLADEEVAEAKRYFLHWSDERVLDTTPYGDLLARPSETEPGRIYIRGVRVAEEETFLFSYNVTRLTAKLSRALNRERSNVGRQAYGERVKDILLAATSSEAMLALAADLGEFETGDQHTESTWVDVAVHASRVVNATEPVVFVTPPQLARGGPFFDYAREEGNRLLVVPTKVLDKLAVTEDIHGEPIRTIDVFARQWVASFELDIVDPDDLAPAERATLALADDVFDAGGVRGGRWPVVVSETMRPSVKGTDAAGLWDGKRIVVKRDVLLDRESFVATLLHEVAHALSRADDATLEFESTLTQLLGRVGMSALSARRPAADTASGD